MVFLDRKPEKYQFPKNLREKYFNGIPRNNHISPRVTDKLTLKTTKRITNIEREESIQVHGPSCTLLRPEIH